MKNSNKKINKILLYTFPVLALLLCLFSAETSQAAKNALYLCIDVVIPSLFPFFVLSGIIMPFLSGLTCPNLFKGLIEKFLRLPYYTVIIILLGFLSGYPNGAKMTRDMFNEGLIDSQQATKLLTKVNYCSPLFVVGTIGAGLFKSLKIGLFLLLIHWISGILAAFITSKIIKNNKTPQKLNSHRYPNANHTKTQYNKSKSIKSKPISVLLTSSIESAAILCIKLTGYIVFFAVISELLSQLGIFSFFAKGLSLLIGQNTENFSELITATLKGFMEITSGAQAINQVKGMQLNIQLASVSLIFGFAGFSAHCQIVGLMSGSGAKYNTFFFAKVIHGVLACLLTLVFAFFMPITVESSSIYTLPPNIYTYKWIRPIVILGLLASLIIGSFIMPKNNREKNNT